MAVRFEVKIIPVLRVASCKSTGLVNIMLVPPHVHTALSSLRKPDPSHKVVKLGSDESIILDDVNS